GLQAGADQYLTKPFTASQLADAVRDMLDRARPGLAAVAAGAATRASARTGAMLAGASALGATALPRAAEAG
ncbi:MAG: hypothetical protein JWO79_1187, partial [Actinomycetia bacterium]|nr:hypothetical protein [Actinomycetes bacterium]